jgi:hypothetical protein
MDKSRASRILDFRFWILDCAVRMFPMGAMEAATANPKSQIQNPKSAYSMPHIPR